MIEAPDRPNHRPAKLRATCRREDSNLHCADSQPADSSVGLRRRCSGDAMASVLARCPRLDSNQHYTASKAADSSVGLRGQRGSCEEPFGGNTGIRTQVLEFHGLPCKPIHYVPHGPDGWTCTSGLTVPNRELLLLSYTRRSASRLWAWGLEQTTGFEPATFRWNTRTILRRPAGHMTWQGMKSARRRCSPIELRLLVVRIVGIAPTASRTRTARSAPELYPCGVGSDESGGSRLGRDNRNRTGGLAVPDRALWLLSYVPESGADDRTRTGNQQIKDNHRQRPATVAGAEKGR